MKRLHTAWPAAALANAEPAFWQRCIESSLGGCLHKDVQHCLGILKHRPWPCLCSVSCSQHWTSAHMRIK